MSYFFNRINSAPLGTYIPFSSLKKKLINISNVTEIFNVSHVPRLSLKKKTVGYSNFILAGLDCQSVNPNKNNIPIVFAWTRFSYDKPVSNDLTDCLQNNYKTINRVNSRLKNSLNIGSDFNLGLTQLTVQFSSKIRKIKNNQFKNIFLYFFKEIFYMDSFADTLYSKNSYLIFFKSECPTCRTYCAFLAKNSRNFSVSNNGLALILGNNKQESMLKKPNKYYQPVKKIKKNLFNNILEKQINIKKFINNYKNLFNILAGCSYFRTAIPVDSESVSPKIFDFYTFHKPYRGSNSINFRQAVGVPFSLSLNSVFILLLKQIDVNKINNLYINLATTSQPTDQSKEKLVIFPYKALFMELDPKFLKRLWTISPLGPTAYNIKKLLKYYINDITYLIFLKLLKRIFLTENYSFLIYLKTSWLSIKNLIKKSANQTSTILLVFINLYYRFLKFLSFYYFNMTLQSSNFNLKTSLDENILADCSMFYKKNIDNLFELAVPATNSCLNKNQMISFYKKNSSYYIFRAAGCQTGKKKLNVLGWITNQPEPMFIAFSWQIEEFSWLSNYYTDSQMIEQSQLFYPFCIFDQVQRAEDIPVSINFRQAVGVPFSLSLSWLSNIYCKLSMNPVSSQKFNYKNNEQPAKCYPVQNKLLKQLWLLKKKKHNNRSLFWLFKKYFLKTTFRELIYNNIFSFPQRGSLAKNIKMSLILKTHRLFFKNLLVFNWLPVQSSKYFIKPFNNVKITELKNQNRALVVFINTKNEQPANWNCLSVTRFLFLKKTSQLAIFSNYKRKKKLFKCQSKEKQLLLYTFSTYNN